MSKFVPTADLCDDEEKLGTVHFRTKLLHDYGGKQRFFGRAATVRCFEDNGMVSKLLDEPGNGRVLVVDGGGSCARALFGDQMGEKAVRNGWTGIIINGAVRDVGQLKTMNVGVKALGTCPRKSLKRNTGERDVVLEMFGVVIHPNMLVFADEDGVVVLPVNAKL